MCSVQHKFSCFVRIPGCAFLKVKSREITTIFTTRSLEIAWTQDVSHQCFQKNAQFVSSSKECSSVRIYAASLLGSTSFKSLQNSRKFSYLPRNTHVCSEIHRLLVCTLGIVGQCCSHCLVVVLQSQ